jgi:hypothetical protein
MIKVDDVMNEKKNEKDRGTGENARSIAAAKFLGKGTATPAVPKALTIAERLEEDQKFMADKLGLDEPELAVALIRQAKQLVAAFGGGDDEFEIAMPMLFELKPQNLSQALLAVQTAGVHCASLRYLKRAAVFATRNLNSEAVDANMKMAMELMRLSIEQIETMAKLMGKTGQQRVTVEHVNVNHGGQAIVGAVTAPGNGARQEERNENQSGTPSKPPRLAEKRQSPR